MGGKGYHRNSIVLLQGIFNLKLYLLLSRVYLHAYDVFHGMHVWRSDDNLQFSLSTVGPKHEAQVGRFARGFVPEAISMASRKVLKELVIPEAIRK